jgi:hypothetical protein
MPKKKTVQQPVSKFLEKYSGYDMSWDDIALCAAGVEGELGIAAVGYLLAKKNLENRLEKLGYRQTPDADGSRYPGDSAK